MECGETTRNGVYSKGKSSESEIFTRLLPLNVWSSGSRVCDPHVEPRASCILLFVILLSKYSLVQ